MAVLIALGAAFEITGIALVGASEVMPGLRRRAARVWHGSIGCGAGFDG